MDPSGLKKNLRIDQAEFESRCVSLTEAETQAARERLESFMGALLAASVTEFDKGLKRPPLAYGLDATAVATTASRVPGALGDFPNVVVGLALERPGIDPGSTAVRVLKGVISRGFAPGPLGCDRAYSAALVTKFHLPVRAMGFDLVIDYRIDQLGRQANSHGAVLIEGTWYCPSMPEMLVNATIDLRSGVIDAATYEFRIEAHADYALRRKCGPDRDGYERFTCPAQGAVPKVRCELRPPSLQALGARTVPDPPHDPPALCRQGSITIARTSVPDASRAC